MRMRIRNTGSNIQVLFTLCGIKIKETTGTIRIVGTICSHGKNTYKIRINMYILFMHLRDAVTQTCRAR
jgi:hypothetical protein